MKKHKLFRRLRRIKRKLASLPKPRRIFVVSLAIFILVSLLLGAVWSIVASVKAAANAKRRAQAEPLEMERVALECRLVELEKRLSEKVNTGSTLATIYIGADKAIYENVWPVYVEMNELLTVYMTEGEKPEESEEEEETEEEEPTEEEEELPEIEIPRMTGTICLSPTELPGQAGKLTMDQLGAILDDGWVTAVFVPTDDMERLDEYLGEMRAHFDSLGLAWTDTVVFDCRSYVPETTPILEAHGISCAVNWVEEGDDILSDDLDGDIWQVKADGWSLSKSKGSAIDNYNTLVSSAGGMAFLFEIWHGANREGPTHFQPYTADSSLKRMLEKFVESIALGEMRVDSASSAYGCYKTYYDELTLRKEMLEPEREKIVKRLVEIRAELEEIYSLG